MKNTTASFQPAARAYSVLSGNALAVTMSTSNHKPLPTLHLAT